MNEIKPSKKLQQLAKIIGEDFYIVGGFVRNCLLGRACDDEDVCSPLTLSMLEKKLAGSEFKLKNKNALLGTCKIVSDEKSFDYATFRSESYLKGHMPVKVEFIDSLEKDASRRDFTINAIYYQISSGKIIDPFGGIKDLKKRRIRAVRSDILDSDGLRILRMIRLAGEYNFTIEPATLAAAERNKDNVSDLTKAKFGEEVQKLFDRTSAKGAVRAIKLYNKLGLWRRAKFDIDKIKPRMIAKCEDKIIGFAIDVVDSVKPSSVSYFLAHMLDESGMPKKKIALLINIVSGYYDALNHLKNKQYFFKYFDNFPIIYEVLLKKSKFLAQKYNFFYRYIISHKLVIKKSDLKIHEKDLKKNFPSMPEKMYNSVLMEVLSDVFDGKCQNEPQELLKTIGKKHYHKF